MRWVFMVFMLICTFIASVYASDGQLTNSCGFREYEWNDSTRDRMIKIAAWFPTNEQSMPIGYGPLQGNARAGAAITPGKHPLIVISHGTGGNRYNQFYLSESLARHGHIILAVQHPRNCAGDDGDADLLVNLWNRPKDISFALDQALKEPGLADYIDSAKVGVIGHSLGGYTALVLVGAKPDIGKLDSFCDSFWGLSAGEFCGAKEQELESWRKGEFLDFSHLEDSRFRAAFVMAPGVPILFDKAAMASIRARIFVFLSGRDEVLKGREQAYREYLPPDTIFVELPDAGHYVYLMECPDVIRQRNLEVCQDIGTSRANVHPMLQREAISFFDDVMGDTK